MRDMLGHLGKYRLDARLGGGGMAEVFVASTIGAEGFARKVAIKRVLPGYSENTQFAQMFVAEAQISSRMQHPNIVSVLDFDRDAEGRLFLVMELVEGKDLDAVLSTGLLPFPVVIFVMAEMLRGLAYAHDLPAGTDDLRGIVHRDVSPHNVLLSWEGAVKVSDFGIAKARAASEATASVFIKGKPAYMSPEQANGEPLDGRSDLFAVGVMLWEMLVGRRLFVGGDTRSLLTQVLFSPIPRPRQQRADVPKDLDRICMKMLERELLARYSAGEEIIADLLRCEDAPRGGREEMTALLAQRFEPEYPKRQSRRLTGRPVSSQGLESGAPAPSHPASPVGADPRRASADHPSTMIGHGGDVPSTSRMVAAARPASAWPGSVDRLMAADTRTIAPSRRRLSAKVVIGSTLGALSLLAAVLVGLFSRGGNSADPVDAAGITSSVASTDANASGQRRPALDAGPLTDAPPDASVRAPDAGNDKPLAKPQARGHARITFSTDPPMDMYVDGRGKGATPRTLVLDAGPHRIKFVNSEIGVTDTFGINVEADTPQTVYKKYPQGPVGRDRPP
jgi:serine/threonine protein kinase